MPDAEDAEDPLIGDLGDDDSAACASAGGNLCAGEGDGGVGRGLRVDGRSDPGDGNRGNQAAAADPVADSDDDGARVGGGA